VELPPDGVHGVASDPAHAAPLPRERAIHRFPKTLAVTPISRAQLCERREQSHGVTHDRIEVGQDRTVVLRIAMVVRDVDAAHRPDLPSRDGFLQQAVERREARVEATDLVFERLPFSYGGRLREPAAGVRQADFRSAALVGDVRGPSQLFERGFERTSGEAGRGGELGLRRRTAREQRDEDLCDRVAAAQGAVARRSASSREYTRILRTILQVGQATLLITGNDK
jgi:hypothetical protein